MESENDYLWLADLGSLVEHEEVLLKYRQHFQSVSHLHHEEQLTLPGQPIGQSGQRQAQVGSPPDEPDRLAWQ